MTDFASPDLLERYGGFAYDYRMRCGCGGAVALTASMYDREQSNEARVPLRGLRRRVHFGPAVACWFGTSTTPRLDNGAVSRFAWYHTSTWPDWPSPGHRASVEELFREADRRLIGDVGEAIERHATRALHLGTYEASVETRQDECATQADGASMPPRLAVFDLDNRPLVGVGGRGRAPERGQCCPSTTTGN